MLTFLGPTSWVCKIARLPWKTLRLSPHQLHAYAGLLQVMGVYAVATTYMNTGTASTKCKSSLKLLSSTGCHSGSLGALLSEEVVRPVDAVMCAVGVLGIVKVSAAGKGCLMGAAKRVLMVTAPAAAASVVTSGKPAQHQVSLYPCCDLLRGSSMHPEPVPPAATA